MVVRSDPHSDQIFHKAKRKSAESSLIAYGTLFAFVKLRPASQPSH